SHASISGAASSRRSRGGARAFESSTTTMSISTKPAPPVTVALPTIGRMDYLPALLASLEAQTFGDFEALILDNASPPEAQALFAEQVKKDARFRVLRADERVPMFTNFNRGWLEMRGKYLVYFHDDDVYS